MQHAPATDDGHSLSAPDPGRHARSRPACGGDSVVPGVNGGVHSINDAVDLSLVGGAADGDIESQEPGHEHFRALIDEGFRAACLRHEDPELVAQRGPAGGTEVVA